MNYYFWLYFLYYILAIITKYKTMDFVQSWPLTIHLGLCNHHDCARISKLLTITQSMGNPWRKLSITSTHIHHDCTTAKIVLLCAVRDWCVWAALCTFTHAPKGDLLPKETDLTILISELSGFQRHAAFY